MEWIYDGEIWASLATLAALEIVLGIDNLVFLTIVVSKLPAEQQPTARRLGLAGALIMRVVFLVAIFWITRLVEPIFTFVGQEFSWRDIILIAGGGFLLVKGTLEIHSSIERDQAPPTSPKVGQFAMAIVQIAALDLVFSIDSVITAIGMAEHLGVMIAAVFIAIAVMLFAAGPVGSFVERHPTVKMLALSFLMLIGVALIADGFDYHIPREFLYFAIVFSIAVEGLNLLAARRQRTRADRD